MQPGGKRVQSPITLFVESVDFRPFVEYRGDRVTIVDLEITEPMAREIVVELQKRLEQGFNGAIRMRFSGRLVL